MVQKHYYKPFWIILISILLFSSCKKNKGDWITTVEGKITEYYSGDNLSNIGLIIEECKTPLVTSTHCKILDTIYSDSNGLFYQKFTGTYSDRLFDDGELQISVLYSKYYANSDVKDVIIDNLNSYDFRIKPLKLLKLILQDSSENCDKLEIHLSCSGYTEENNISLSNLFSKDTVINDLIDTDTVLMTFIPESEVYVTSRFFNDGVYKGYKTVNKYIENIEPGEMIIKY